MRQPRSAAGIAPGPGARADPCRARPADAHPAASGRLGSDRSGRDEEVPVSLSRPLVAGVVGTAADLGRRRARAGGDPGSPIDRSIAPAHRPGRRRPAPRAWTSSTCPPRSPASAPRRRPASRVWLTVQNTGGLGEIFYPTADAPASRTTQFVVADRRGGAVRAEQAADVRTVLADPASLTYRQTFTERHGRWRLTATYVTDPARSSVLARPRVHARRPRPVLGLRRPRPGARQLARRRLRPHRRGAPSSPPIRAPRTIRRRQRAGRAPTFAATSNGFRGTSDGWTDLLADGRIDWRYASAAAGNLVQTARARLDRRGTRDAGARLRRPTPTPRSRPRAPRCGAGFTAVAHAYAAGWQPTWPACAAPPPVSATATERELYRVSAMVLAASEDKTLPRRVRRLAALAVGVRPRRPRPAPTTWSGRATSTRSPPR